MRIKFVGLNEVSQQILAGSFHVRHFDLSIIYNVITFR